MKVSRYIVVFALLMLCIAGMASAQGDYTYPTVTFAFDDVTFEYKYTVTMTSADSFPFAYLELDTLVANAGETAWTMFGPVAGGTNLNWSTDWFTWDSYGDGVTRWDAAIWYADPDRNQNPIYPSNWIGVFTLVAPNTQPYENGIGLTMDGGIWSQHPFEITVPGPAPLVPEPSSLAALATGLMGLTGVLVRRRKV